jgi:hypothetical protein
MWVMLRVLDLQERVIVSEGGLTLFAEVKIFADSTLITNSDNWVGATSVTGDSVVDLLVSLFDLFFDFFNLFLLDFGKLGWDGWWLAIHSDVVSEDHSEIFDVFEHDICDLGFEVSLGVLLGKSVQK